jgi:hypothetical protein
MEYLEKENTSQASMGWEEWGVGELVSVQLSLIDFKWLNGSQMHWLKSVILATQLAQIGRMPVWGQSRQKACETPSQQLGTVVSTWQHSYTGKHK